MTIRHWDDRLSRKEEINFLSTLASMLLTRIQNPELRSSLESVINDRGPEGLLEYPVDYTLPYSATDFLYMRQVLALYEKSPSLATGIDTRRVAEAKWVDAERICRQSNEIFQRHARGEFTFSPRVEAVFHGAQRKIARVLGDLPTLDELKLRFGPGATTSLRKRSASARRKLSERITCSEDLLPILTDVLEAMPGWMDNFPSAPDLALIEVDVSPSRLEFVPKNAKTDRAIAVEPMLNQMVQLGIGDVIAERLRREAGIDIRDQIPNQEMARIGSITGDLATLDLSSASDLVSRELVFHLLPVDWALFLDTARTGTIEFNGMRLRLEKFSSMGNGFTFPLETLIFWALSAAASDELGEDYRGRLRVYGDDIIVPSSCFSFVAHVLHCAGFSLNLRKSFNTGKFRESCGKDYFGGIDIRPCYVKDRMKMSDIFRLHNFFVAQYDEDLAFLCEQFVPRHLRLYGPSDYGDGHLHVRDPSNYLRVHRRDRGWSGYTFDTFTLKSRRSFKPYPGDYVYPSYTVYISEGMSETEHAVRGDSFAVPLPGASGCKRISIYTLSLG